MSIYSKELFTGPVAGATSPTAVAATATPQNDQSTACSNHDASDCISSAVAVTMIEGYIAFRAKNHTLTNLNEALDLVSTMTKDMVDNGDITSCQLEQIKGWVKEKSSMFVNAEECCKHKLMCKILKNCGECGEGASPALQEFINQHKALEAAKAKVLQELGPSIQNAITQFINRYGKLMDETYLKAWS